jgi:hypothetical protein
MKVNTVFSSIVTNKNTYFYSVNPQDVDDDLSDFEDSTISFLGSSANQDELLKFEVQVYFLLDMNKR